MRIYITGVSGFVGRHLARTFLDAGHTVLGSGSALSSRPRAPQRLARFDVLTLGSDAVPGAFANTDVIIHGAFHAAPETESLNVDGTLRWATSATRDHVGQQFFLSSHSAAATAPSAYGRQKHRLETTFLKRGHRVVRPGLVIGNGGLFRRMMDLVSRLPIVPLIDGGRARTPVTAPDDLAHAVARLFDDVKTPSSVNLFSRNRVPLVDLLRSLRQALGRRVPLVPIPSALLLPPLWLARQLGITVPVDEENVHGYRAIGAHAHSSDYPAILDQETPLTTMVEAAVRHLRAEQAGQAPWAC